MAINETTCRRCGRTILAGRSSQEPNRDLWSHIDAQGDLIRGCYAASFLNEGEYADGSAWDTSLNRRWKATP